jgi:hypothetical protein
MRRYQALRYVRCPTASLYTVGRHDLHCMRRMAILKKARCSADLGDHSAAIVHPSLCMNPVRGAQET